MATGSELILAVEAHEQLTAEGIRSRVVSMPSWRSLSIKRSSIAKACFPARSLRGWRWSRLRRLDGNATPASRDVSSG